MSFTEKDDARPGLTQEGCFLVGAGDQQCPLCFAELWPSVISMPEMSSHLNPSVSREASQGQTHHIPSLV